MGGKLREKIREKSIKHKKHFTKLPN